MDFQNILKLSAVGIVCLAIGGILGYTQMPDKVKIEEKIVEKIVKEKDTKTTKKYDPTTGKLTEETVEVKDKQTNIDSKDKTVDKEKSQKMYSLKVGAVVNPRSLNSTPIARVGGDVKLPILPLFVGAEVDLSINQPLVGAFMRLEF